MDHAQTVTKAQIETNMNKQDQFVKQLKRNSKEQPEIDEFTLQATFQNYVKRLSYKIGEIKDFCKKGDLDKALQMQNELMVFSK